MPSSYEAEEFHADAKFARLCRRAGPAQSLYDRY